MPLHFKHLNIEAHQARVQMFADSLQALKSRWSNLDFRSFSSWIRQLDPRLDCEQGEDACRWIIRYASPSAIPLAHWIVSVLPKGRDIIVGRPSGSIDEALNMACRSGVDLSTSRVRVGFSRGHLLEIYVFVPLDVSANADQLQLASEIFLEVLLGDAMMDDWVASVDVDRIARSKGLLVVSDARSNSVSYPLSEVRNLVERGVAALREGLPDSVIGSHAESSDWTALTIAATTGSMERQGLPQPDRRFASTRFPEALKACLQGLPFSSARFCRGAEIWISLSWRAQDADQRIALREQVERRLTDPLTSHNYQVRAGVDFLLGGTGFGNERDYVDLWVRDDEANIRTVVMAVAQYTKSVTLEFYDTKWQDEGGTYSCA